MFTGYEGSSQTRKDKPMRIIVDLTASHKKLSKSLKKLDRQMKRLSNTSHGISRNSLYKTKHPIKRLKGKANDN